MPVSRRTPSSRGIEVPLSGRILPSRSRHPQVVQYRGARYVLAQDAQEIAEKNVMDLTRGVRDHAEKLLKKVGIKFAAEAEIASSGENDANPDGFELKYNLQAGNFSGLSAELYIDYLVKGKNALGEPASWWESALSFIKSKEEVQNFGGTYNLNQMVFRFCKGNHASTPDKSPKIPQMLETIAFLQGAGELVEVKSSRDEGIKLPEDQQAASDQLIKAMNALKQHYQGKAIGGKTYPNAKHDKWSTSAQWEELFTDMAKTGAGGLTAQVADAFLTEIKQLEKDGSLADMVKNLEKLAKKPGSPKSMEGPGGVRGVLKTKLATVINQGPYRINYTAWDRMAISGDADGNMILKIAAPMKPYFTFEKSAGGVPTLFNASCMLCGKIFSSAPKDAVAASKLAWTGVVLGRGAALGINPVETEHMVEETWLADLKNQLPAAEKVEEKPATETAPSVGEEAPPEVTPAAEPVRTRQ